MRAGMTLHFRCGVILPDGCYAVPMGIADEYRVIMVKTVDKPGAIFGKRCVFHHKGRGWKSVAFLNDDGSLDFYLKTKVTYAQEQMKVLQSAVTAILQNPLKAKVKSKKHIVSEILAGKKADAGALGLWAKQLKCKECGSDFILEVSEQKFYEEREFPEPKRCRECRKKRKVYQKELKNEIYEAARRQGSVRELFVNDVNIGALMEDSK